jgi:hypothetical protein
MKGGISAETQNLWRYTTGVRVVRSEAFGREATPDGAANTAERLTSHPTKESDMGTTDDTLRALNQLERTIHKQREQLLQAHGVLTCLYEVMLHADGELAVSYAQATYVARGIINATAEELDSVHISPLLDALARADKVDELRVLPVN